MITVIFWLKIGSGFKKVTINGSSLEECWECVAGLHVLNHRIVSKESA